MYVDGPRSLVDLKLGVVGVVHVDALPREEVDDVLEAIPVAIRGGDLRME